MIIRAKFLIPFPDQCIENGAVAIMGRVITAVGKYHEVSRTAVGPPRDLGEAVLLPGLVNAHCHTELSGLKGAVPFRGKFVDWLIRVRAARNERSRADLREWAERGVRQSVQSGTTTLGDYTQTLASVTPLRVSGLRGVLFFETLGFPTAVARRRAWKTAWHLWRIRPSDLIQTAVAPHAPYSVSADLYTRLFRIARKRGILFSTHINECQEEIEFYEHGAGDFRTMLTNLGLWRDSWKPPGVCPVRHLERLELIDSNTVLIHCNYLSEGDCDLIASHGAGVVFCPRSHSFFGHKDHPFQKLLKRGVSVALGTDSLASNDSLSILDEMRAVLETYPGVSPGDVLRMATEYGARVLHMADRVGRLAAGLQADVIAIALPPLTADPFVGIMQPSARPIYTMVAGQALYDFRSPTW